MDFEKWVNDEKARECAKKVKEYCKTHKNCKEDKCKFWIGTCSLNRYPSDWNFEELK